MWSCVTNAIVVVVGPCCELVPEISNPEPIQFTVVHTEEELANQESLNRQIPFMSLFNGNRLELDMSMNIK